MKLFHRFADLVHGLVGFATGLLLGLMLLVVVILVVARYVFSIPIFGGDELARYLMFYMVMVGSTVAIRLDQHPRLTLVLAMLSERHQKCMRLVIDLMVALVLGVMFYHGLDMANEEAITSTPSLRWSFFWVYIAIPIGAATGLVELIALWVPGGTKAETVPTDRPSEIA
jgi:TRAP-type transport system small permease protein